MKKNTLEDPGLMAGCPVYFRIKHYWLPAKFGVDLTGRLRIWRDSYKYHYPRSKCRFPGYIVAPRDRGRSDDNNCVKVEMGRTICRAVSRDCLSRSIRFIDNLQIHLLNYCSAYSNSGWEVTLPGRITKQPGIL